MQETDQENANAIKNVIDIRPVPAEKIEKAISIIADHYEDIWWIRTATVDTYRGLAFSYNAASFFFSQTDCGYIFCILRALNEDEKGDCIHIGLQVSDCMGGPLDLPRYRVAQTFQLEKNSAAASYLYKKFSYSDTEKLLDKIIEDIGR